MATALIIPAEVAAEAVAETAAETAAEAVAESVAEVAAEAAAEAAAEGTAERAAEAAAEEAAEGAAEVAAEAAAEVAAEDAAEAAVEDAEERAAEKKVVGKIIRKVAIQLVIDSIKNHIMALTGAGKKKCPMTDDVRTQLDLVDDALLAASDMVSDWSNKLSTLPQTADFGVLQVDVHGEKKETPVSSLFWEILTDVQKNLQDAETIYQTCTENCEWEANLMVYTNKVVQAITGLLAVCHLRKKSPFLQQIDVPRASDLATAQALLDKDFPDWKKFIDKQAKKNLDKLAIQEASSAAKDVVLPIVRGPIKTETVVRLKKELLPSIVSKAKRAGKDAAKHVFHSRRGHIIAISLIPIYGLVKAALLVKAASRDAKRVAKSAAKESVNQSFASTQVKSRLESISKEVSDKVFHQHQAEIDQKVDATVKEILQKYK